MPGQKKRVWKGNLLWGGEGLIMSAPTNARFIIPVVIPDNDPGRVIHVEVSREAAKELGMALWEWGSA